MTSVSESRQERGVTLRTSGERSDFRAIFDDNFDYVWNTLRYLGVRTADLEDVTHEVFVRVHQRFDERDPSRAVRPWLFAFAFRVAAGHRRRAHNHNEVVGLTREPPDPAQPLDEQIIAKEERELAFAAVQSIDIDRRAVFVMHELDEIPIPEIATALGIPTNTAYSRLRIARGEFNAAAARLRRVLGVLEER
jgi:RNA polymerase sigma-70 factor (ECF subfamily)